MIWLLPFAACVDPEPPADTGTATASEPVAPALHPVVRWSETVANVPFVSVDPPSGLRWRVVYGLDGARDQQTPETDADSIAVLGLKSGRTYEAEIVSVGTDAPVTSEPFVLSVPPAPPELPSLEILSRTADAEMGRGWVLTSVTEPVVEGFGDTFVVIYDGDGDPVWWVRSALGHITMTPSLGATPGTLLWDDYDWSAPGLDASVVRMGLDGSDPQQAPLPWGHHAAIELEPGVIAWAARDVRPSPTTPDAFVTADRLFEAPLGETAAPREVVTLYDAVFDGVFGAPCVHSTIELTLEDITPLFEWSHLNSVVYLPDRDAVLLHLRWIDAVVLVERSSGEILWQMSGPYGEFLHADGSPIWSGSEAAILSHAHLSQAWDGGLVAFDNGSHHTPPWSSIVELAWNEEARTVEEVFRWVHPDRLQVAILGDVRKLPEGGYLASWSTVGELTEVAPDGTIRWRARTTDGKITMRVVWLGSLYPE